MSGIASSISDLIGSVLNVFKALIQTVFSAIEGVLSVFGTAVTDVAGLARSVVDLVLTNIIPIGIIVAAIVGYSAFQQRQGQQVQGSTFSKKMK